MNRPIPYYCGQKLQALNDTKRNRTQAIVKEGKESMWKACVELLLHISSDLQQAAATKRMENIYFQSERATSSDMSDCSRWQQVRESLTVCKYGGAAVKSVERTRIYSLVNFIQTHLTSRMIHFSSRNLIRKAICTSHC